MPYKRRTKKYKKKNYRRRRYKRDSNQPVTSLKRTTPLPRVFKTTLRYNEPQGATLNPGAAGIVSTYMFSANGLYDPNISAGGHQCSGWDQLMTMYDHATVIAARITVNFFNTDTTNAQIVGIDIRDNNITETDVRPIIESGMCKYRVLAPAGNGRSSATLTYNLNPNKFLGLSKPLSTALVRNTVSSNPVEQAYFHIWGAPQAQVDSGAITIDATIDYVVVFTEPKPVGIS